jgi:hypothetical protein
MVDEKFLECRLPHVLPDPRDAADVQRLRQMRKHDGEKPEDSPELRRRTNTLANGDDGLRYAGRRRKKPNRLSPNEREVGKEKFLRVGQVQSMSLGRNIEC